jgi:hypothetical protein
MTTYRTHRAVLAGALLVTVAPLAWPGQSVALPADAPRVVRLEADLRPSGDPDGSGEAHFRLRPARHRVCAVVEWSDIGTPNAAHIHRRSDGGVVVDLTGSVTGGDRCATGVPKRVVKRIAAHPRRYYFNVHNDTYPDGAIQGRLHR